MASLQCPSCGNKHPVDIIPDTETFACQQCRRLLKVPDALRNRRVDAIVSSRPAGTGDPGAGGRISTLPATEVPAPPPSARSAAGPVAAPSEHPGVNGAARPAPPGGRPGAPAARAPFDGGEEILAPPPSPAASAALATPMLAPDGSASPTAVPPLPAVSPVRDDPMVVDHAVVDVAAAEVAPVVGPVRVHWLVRLLIWIVALAVAAIAVVVPYRRVGLIDFDGALKVIGGRGFEQWELPLIIVPPWAMGTALIAHFSIEGLARLRRRSLERSAAAATAMAVERS
jgi:hypothetical protein